MTKNENGGISGPNVLLSIMWSAVKLEKSLNLRSKRGKKPADVSLGIPEEWHKSLTLFFKGVINIFHI